MKTFETPCILVGDTNGVWVEEGHEVGDDGRDDI
jgi:hypothetical protein